jgi:hypothetical protein
VIAPPLEAALLRRPFRARPLRPPGIRLPHRPPSTARAWKTQFQVSTPPIPTRASPRRATSGKAAGFARAHGRVRRRFRGRTQRGVAECAPSASRHESPTERWCSEGAAADLTLRPAKSARCAIPAGPARCRGPPGKLHAELLPTRGRVPASTPPRHGRRRQSSRKIRRAECTLR